MRVRILKEVPVLLDGEAVRLKPGAEIDRLEDHITAALIRGGDAEAVSAPSAPDRTTPEDSAVSSFAKRNFGGKKNRGASPENK